MTMVLVMMAMLMFKIYGDADGGAFAETAFDGGGGGDDGDGDEDDGDDYDGDSVGDEDEGDG